MPPPNTWMVRSGRGGFLFDVFKEKSVVGLGWARIGAAALSDDRATLIRAIQNEYPDEAPGYAVVAAGQIYRFAHDVAVGDRVVTYDPRARIYLCGEIIGPREFHPEEEDEELTNRRAVIWRHERSRDDLSQAARNTLGATLTLFLLPPSVAAELWSAPRASDEPPPALAAPAPNAIETGPPLLADATHAQLTETANERIKDRIARLAPYEMQDLVAGLLRAMGYVTTVSPPGSDRGRDILASPDGFGFKDPRIVVEVKHRPEERMGAPEVRGFIGGRKTHEKCLFVSTGGFTKEAYYEAERSTIPLTLLDFEELVAAVLTNYGEFDEATRRLIPLATVFWPL